MKSICEGCRALFVPEGSFPKEVKIYCDDCVNRKKLPIHQRPSDEEGGSTCENCGCEYKIILELHDDLWKAIKPRKDIRLLCGSCIMERLERFDTPGVYALDDIMFEENQHDV